MLNDAVEYWNNLGLHVDDEDYREASPRAQAMAIAIEGVSELGLLHWFKIAIRRGLEFGLQVAEIREWLCSEHKESDLKDYLGGKKLVAKSNASAKKFAGMLPTKKDQIDLAIKTSLLRAEQAGYWRFLHRGAANFGERVFFVYVANLHGQGCESHRSLNALIRSREDPVWLDFFPPNGLDCECRLYPLAESIAENWGLAQTSGDGLARMMSGLSNFSVSFKPAEHFLLPHADSKTSSFKVGDNSVEQRRQNARYWDDMPGLSDAMKKRHEDCVDLFAADEHNVSSRNELSVDVAVLPSNMPEDLGGHVITFSDTLYKVRKRELIRKLTTMRSEQKQGELFADLTDEELRKMADEILKSIHSAWLPGKRVGVGINEFYLEAATGLIWLRFRQVNIDEKHYFELDKIAYVRDLGSWVRKKQRRKKRKVPFGIYTVE